MKSKLSIIAIILSTLAILGLFLVANQPEDSRRTENQTTYDRVVESGKIRAAYTIYPPGCLKDKNGELKGIFVETLEQAAKNLKLEVEWVEEVGWATQIEGLKTNRYDMIGSSVWANPKRARLTTLSKPLYYSPLYIYARQGDQNFVGLDNFDSINKSNVRISTVDGGTGETIAKVEFPNANLVSPPQMTDFGTSFMDVVHKKADIVIMEPYHAKKFIENNGRKIQNIAPEKPLRVFGNTYMFGRGEVEFQNMLNVAIDDLINSGYVNKLIDKYEGYENSQLRVATDYIQEK